MAYSLSKQSNLAGYRAAFVVGDPELIDPIAQVRKHAGMMLPAPVQAAMVATLTDDEHVAVQRERYRARRERLRAGASAYGLQVEDSEAGLYLWASAGRAAGRRWTGSPDLGLLCAPGSFYGAAGGQHVRIALTATDAQIDAAARRLGA